MVTINRALSRRFAASGFGAGVMLIGLGVSVVPVHASEVDSASSVSSQVPDTRQFIELPSRPSLRSALRLLSEVAVDEFRTHSNGFTGGYTPNDQTPKAQLSGLQSEWVKTLDGRAISTSGLWLAPGADLDEAYAALESVRPMSTENTRKAATVASETLARRQALTVDDVEPEDVDGANVTTTQVDEDTYETELSGATIACVVDSAEPLRSSCDKQRLRLGTQGPGERMGLMKFDIPELPRLSAVADSWISFDWARVDSNNVNSYNDGFYLQSVSADFDDTATFAAPSKRVEDAAWEDDHPRAFPPIDTYGNTVDRSQASGKLEVGISPRLVKGWSIGARPNRGIGIDIATGDGPDLTIGGPLEADFVKRPVMHIRWTMPASSEAGVGYASRSHSEMYDPNGFPPIFDFSQTGDEPMATDDEEGESEEELSPVQYSHSLMWDSVKGYDPVQIPSDWGLESGVTLWNEDVDGSIRPYCQESAAYDFLATTFDEAEVREDGVSWWSNVPALAEPYVDENIFFDPCESNSLEFGIGTPQILDVDTTYTFYTHLPKGEQDFSVFSSSMAIKTDNCGDQVANSDCMGLNTFADPPEGYELSKLTTARSRGLTMPSCVVFSEHDSGEWTYDPDYDYSAMPEPYFCPNNS